MPHPSATPFGTWSSPVTSELVASAAINLADVLLDGGNVYWVEGRPQEAGRHVLIRHNEDGARLEVTPQPLSARTRVHEYGGAAALVADGIGYFSNFQDQRLYRIEGDGPPVPLTPPAAPGQPNAALRYADGQIDNGVVLCPLHLNVFSLDTGCSTTFDVPLTTYRVSVEADNALVVYTPASN